MQPAAARFPSPYYRIVKAMLQRKGFGANFSDLIPHGPIAAYSIPHASWNAFFIMGRHFHLFPRIRLSRLPKDAIYSKQSRYERDSAIFSRINIFALYPSSHKIFPPTVRLKDFFLSRFSLIHRPSIYMASALIPLLDRF